MLRSYLRPYLWLLRRSILLKFLIAPPPARSHGLSNKRLMMFSTIKTPDHVAAHPIGVMSFRLVKGLATYLSNVILNFVGQRSTANCSVIYLRAWCAVVGLCVAAP